MEKNKVVIFGAGETAEIAYYYMKNDPHFKYQISGFICDDQFHKNNNFLNLPLIPFSDAIRFFPPANYNMIIALSYVGLNSLRKKKYFEAKEKGYNLISFVCSKSFIWPGTPIGDNCLILDSQTIQPKVRIGNNVMIWSGNHLGHGSSIGDHSYLSSQICLSGYSKIGESCFIGVNSTFKNNIKVGNRVLVGMGANVTSNIEDDEVVLANKMVRFKATDKISNKIKESL